MKYCQNCGEKVTEGSRFCQNCGFDFDFEDAGIDKNYERRQTSSNTNFSDYTFKKVIDIVLEVMAWLFGTIGAFTIYGDVSTAVALVIAYILALQNDHIRFKVLMIISIVLFILVSLSGFVNGFIGSVYY
ncbi:MULTISPECIES: zinc-ribbon domain-containing protein [Enterococcus]|uniref:zinc-ribbon domain-containing protein n=1 Tax=Enterococcus TaxID=1350 RepID=UPI0021E8BD0B|nr:zinc ribbon domain-containing protein [Enterococcus hirae]MCV3097176.1 zinc ribbon domain-containing protein [Enterococcus hirae]MCV3104844.1 zinc ribbon domain-containing protein [Enterococcus hirae]MCV3109791.1 zinc ribbon domain-containing protein [Enterococcus hirae]MCV3124782.1 zinc ribbon domain-containing protein [Enterococcus hirae]MCV3129790.1 zinc ribbon domain-containing protein [Enterococcus hirae]